MLFNGNINFTLCCEFKHLVTQHFAHVFGDDLREEKREGERKSFLYIHICAFDFLGKDTEIDLQIKIQALAFS